MFVVFEVRDEKGEIIGHSSSRTLTDKLAFGRGPLETHAEIKEIEVWEHAGDLPPDVLERLTPPQDFEDGIPF